MPPSQVTVAVRLAGPLQSWGDTSPYLRKATRKQPTYSAVLGLLRAAHGYGRTIPIPGWLYRLDVAVRTDQPGILHTDYHTISERPKLLKPGTLLARKEATPQVTLPNGKGWRYPTKKHEATGKRVDEAPTMVTEREYLQDAVFTLLIGADADTAARLVYQLNHPVWALSLGRKKCVPDQPFVLGQVDGSVLDAASNVPACTPRLGVPENSVYPLHVLHGGPHLHVDGADLDVVDEIPSGPHPHHPKLPNTRRIVHVNAVPVDMDGLLAWRSEHLNPAAATEGSSL